MSFSLYANTRTITHTITWLFIIIAGLIIVVMADMATSDWFFLNVGNVMFIPIISRGFLLNGKKLPTLW